MEARELWEIDRDIVAATPEMSRHENVPRVWVVLNALLDERNEVQAAYTQAQIDFERVFGVTA